MQIVNAVYEEEETNKKIQRQSYAKRTSLLKFFLIHSARSTRISVSEFNHNFAYISSILRRRREKGEHRSRSQAESPSGTARGRRRRGSIRRAWPYRTKRRRSRTRRPSHCPVGELRRRRSDRGLRPAEIHSSEEAAASNWTPMELLRLSTMREGPSESEDYAGGRLKTGLGFWRWNWLKWIKAQDGAFFFMSFRPSLEPFIYFFPFLSFFLK